jgi:hypothetical protein
MSECPALCSGLDVYQLRPNRVNIKTTLRLDKKCRGIMFAFVKRLAPDNLATPQTASGQTYCYASRV